ncbi:MAG TPA: amino acid adenylation domain-containing protein [Streptosporangiaceae bacterium]|nr:amino acid adenylation domain-containing protein [Streptosporangiaceae bacterium]
MAIEDAYPLTRLQAGMLFHSHLDATGSTYHDLSTLKISGPFDEEKLRATLASLIARHEILRSAMDLTGFSEPMQLVHDTAATPLTVADLSGLSAAEQNERVARWRAAETARPFDLAVPPLLRLHAQVAGDAAFWLHLSFHHAILDGWSLSLLTSALLRGYDQSLSGQPASEPRLTTRFRDYVLLERKALADSATGDYWRGLLAGAEVLTLPRWRDDNQASGERLARVHRVPIRAALTEELRGVAASRRVTLKSVLFAAHAAVLARLSGQRRVITGRVANCRPETTDADQMVGLFLGSVPLALDTGRQSWSELARQAHDAETQALPHRRYPLSQILRDLGTDALFETLVDYRAMRGYRAMALSNLTIEETAFFEQTNFPFSANFGADPATGQVSLGINYDQAEFPPDQVTAIGEYYSAALQAMAADPAGQVCAATLMGSAETARHLAEWNSTRAVYPSGRTLPELLAEAARRRPGKVALRTPDRELSYAELFSQADSLAGQLRALGVGPDVIVGVHLRRSAWLVVALLAVLAAGGAYLPLDPEYPADRLAFMLADSGAAVVLTDARSVPPPSAATVIVVDQAGPALAPERMGPAGAGPGNLAYVIYTSGSTGRPKGVQIPHRALVNLLTSMIRETGLTAKDRWLSVTSLSFDIAGLEVFGPLLAGASLVVLADDAVHQPGFLAELGKASIVQATPSAWRLFIEAGLEREPGLRAVCGGEPLPPDLAGLLAARAGQVWNAYGPTETTIWSCLQRVRAGEPVTIGGPLANTRCYVLDDSLRLSPAGAPGELYIGGDGLARGYLGQPGLTAARFVADPFGPSGSRLFRTGDQARRLADGRIDFIGRSDYQVKIRGFRVEPGEIEAVLAAHGSVGQAVAVPRPVPGGHQLVAYFVPAGGAAPGTGPALAELRAHVAAKLPGYMVPSAFVPMEEFPLTPNGKIDRAALPEPDRAGAVEGEIIPPGTATERLIAGIWAQELGLDQVGVTDAFRGLGGHSIAALRIALRIKAATGREVPLAALMTGGTVAALAGLVDHGLDEPASILVPLRHEAPGGARAGGRPLFLAHPLGGTVFCYGDLVDVLPADLPVIGIQAFDMTAQDGPAPDTVDEIAACYVEAVRSVQPRGPYRLGGWCMGGAIAHAMARHLRAAGDEVDLLALIDSSFADPVPPEWADDEAAAIVGAFAERLPLTVQELRQVEPERRLAHALSVAEGVVARPDVGSVDDLRRLVALYRRHALALLAYRDGPLVPYPGDALVICGESAQHAVADLGWGAVVSGQLTVITTAGDHRTLLMSPQVQELADKLVLAMRDGMDAVSTRSRRPA